MSGFTAEWLSLREPADHMARSVKLTRAAIHAMAIEPASILDLAAGTGSNLRYLRNGGAGVAAAADFLLVDHDPALLSRVPKSADVSTRCVDLAKLDDRTLFEGRSMVTASALLDLVSEPWLESLADRCAEAGAVALFVLTYDGRIVCAPEDRADRTIVARVNEHQRRDKGFGPALGPYASASAERCFHARGYRVAVERSDWLLTAASADLQRQLVDGWAQAAAQMTPSDTSLIEDWRCRRRVHIDANESRIVVGHQDLLAIPGAGS
jgi:hypothetical protein